MRISDWSSDVCSSDLMVANCADKPFLEKIVANSMSCSSPAKARYKKLSPRHCGYCVPCLIRRASLEVGLDGDDETLYTVEDLKGHILASDQPEGEHVRSFQLMAKRIRAKPDLAKRSEEHTSELQSTRLNSGH